MKDNEFNKLISDGENQFVEFKEGVSNNFGKEICAFANTNRGFIIVGITDKSVIKGLKDINKLKSQIQDYARKMDPSFSVKIDEYKNLLIVTVNEGLKKPYSSNGNYYMRIGANSQKLNRDELRDLFIEEGVVRFDEKPNKEFDLNKDFNEFKFDDFLNKAKISKELGKVNILNNLFLLKNNYLKNAGVLLFCHRVTKFFMSATISCVLYQGDNKVKILDKKEFNADLYSNYENAITYLYSHLNTEYIIRGGPREERLELPETALREAVINAISHRNYFSTSNIMINIFKDRVEIINPGGLIGNLKIKDLYKTSRPRNPLLFGLLQRMELVEKVGSGLIRIKNAMKNYELSLPKIDANKELFSITLTRPNLQKKTIQERITGNARIVKVSEEERKRWIINYLLMYDKIKVKDFIDKFKISRKTANEDLNHLIKENKIQRKGAGNNVWYEKK